MELDEKEAVQDHRLLLKCGIVLGAVFVAFIANPVLHIEPSVVALLGAGVLVVISGARRSSTSRASSGRRCSSSPASSS